MRKDLYKEGYTQNRELSWLRFNDRVLNEARDKQVPLLERMKFVSIYTSNLNEFFMVRVGSLYDMKKLKGSLIDNKSGYTPKQQLDLIYKESARGYSRRNEVFRDLKRKMRKAGIRDMAVASCSKSEQKFLRRYFRTKVEPLLSAQIVDTRHPFPSLVSGAVHVAAVVKYHGHGVFAFVQIPASLPSIIVLPSKDDFRFVHMEDLVLANLETVFSGLAITEKLKIVITRNADVNPDDDAFDDIVDYRKKMRKVLSQRRKLNAVRLECSAKLSPTLKRYLCDRLHLEAPAVFISDIPLDLRYGFQLGSLMPPEMARPYLYESYEPKLSPAFNYRQKLFGQVQKKDVLLSYPYESMEPFLQLVREAASDPAVASIKISIYRLARQARLVEYLCLAAENGKEVITLIELKARFDEQNNIDYSQRLEDAGCTVLYGFEDYKVHSKICLITRSGKEVASVALLATGNFNENTAKQYTDLAYLTARPSIIRDCEAFFRNMMLGRLDGSYHTLLVAPVSLKPTLLKLIDRETAKKQKGRILIKINAMTDEELIEHLHQASAAGVQIQMIVRGICCLLPGIPGKTDSIHIMSIVGRFLEHSRVYVFGTGAAEKMYISSADFMTRNTERRVEIACPILDPEIRQRIHAYLDCCLNDTVKGRMLKANGRYRRFHDDRPKLDSQARMMADTRASSQQIANPVTVKRVVAFKTKFKGKQK